MVTDTGCTAKNSMSLLRQPGPLSSSVRGESTNYPFLPGMKILYVQNYKYSYSSYLLSTNTMQLKAIFSKIIFCDCQVKLVLIVMLCIVQALIGKCPKKCPVCSNKHY